ncbi:hypothetical protein HJC23_007173 [Cyclotella cryptica]|uniref:Uncharacterized protein n=1 Tax=Cyclotella cryptica TaxID=29204 RepID=A0ABD3QQC8_9STRA|eukprot:CCRYP_003440-RA/>CCRYP_003440-RA protein AED:0.22 eAED:0.22 QI:82/1/1/1/0/0/2/257/145
MSQLSSGNTGGSSNSKDGSTGTKHSTHTHQDVNSVTGLRRSFRAFASTLTIAAKAADKISLASESNSGAGANKEPHVQLKDGVKMTLNARQAMRERASLLEGKLRGNLKESEALHCMLRSQPCVGGKKRTFSAVNVGGKETMSEP